MTEVDESIYKVRSSNKKWSKENIIFLILLIVLSILTIINLICKWGKETPLLLSMILLLLFFMKYDEKKSKKQINQLRTAYKEEVIDKWIDLLKKADWNLYSSDGINWVIRSYEKKMEENNFIENIIKYFKQVCNLFLIPILTLVLTQIVQNSSLQEQSSFLVDYALIVLILAGFGLMIGPFIKLPADLKRSHYKNIIADLEYILIRLPENNQD